MRVVIPAKAVIYNNFSVLQKNRFRIKSGMTREFMTDWRVNQLKWLKAVVFHRKTTAEACINPRPLARQHQEVHWIWRATPDACPIPGSSPRLVMNPCVSFGLCEWANQILTQHKWWAVVQSLQKKVSLLLAPRMLHPLPEECKT